MLKCTQGLSHSGVVGKAGAGVEDGWSDGLDWVRSTSVLVPSETGCMYIDVMQLCWFL